MIKRNDYAQYMIYRCIWSTGVNSKHSIFQSLDFYIWFFPTKWTQKVPPETVKIVFLCIPVFDVFLCIPVFDVKMMYNSIPFNFPFRITCSSCQIHRQHPWLRKIVLQTMSSAPTPTRTISRWFFKICIILFSYLVKYNSRAWHLLLFARVDHTSSTKHMHIVVSILTSKM